MDLSQAGGEPAASGLSRRPYLLLFLLFFGALTVSGVVPLMGLFIVEGMGEPPWKMGIYAAIHVTFTLLANRFYGRRIDDGMRLKGLLIASILAFTTSMIVLSQQPPYLLMITVIALLMGISAASLSGMYTFGRLFAEQTGRDPVKFNSWLRMQNSMGWMFGPALTLSVYGWIGFSNTYKLSAIMGLLWLTLCLAIVPRSFRTHRLSPGDTESDTSYSVRLLIACIPVLAIATCNSAFLSAMALFFTSELGLPPSTAGLALSVKCLVEVPVIYACGYLVLRWGDKKVFMAAALIGVVFFNLIYHVSSVPQVLTLAVLDGIYYGLFAGVSISFVQKYAIERPGIATSYYVSTLFVGGLLGNLTTGAVASIYSFQTTTFISMIFAAMALIILPAIRDPRPEANMSDL